jgi:hypothetical protein
MIELNDAAVNYMQRLGFSDIVLDVITFTS